MGERKISPLYRLIKAAVRAVYPKIKVVGEENLPPEPVVYVGNHSQMNGPIACELYTPGEHYIWCAGEMMDKKEVPAYAYQDFWSEKPKAVRWFYKLLSYIIAPLSQLVFTNANTIGVYHDAKIITTFKKTVTALQEGASVVIFRSITCRETTLSASSRTGSSTWRSSTTSARERRLPLCRSIWRPA